MTSQSQVPLIKLNNEKTIPQIGYGVYLIEGNDETEKCVLEALKAGYRHIDTAHMYQNEKGVGSAIKKSGIPREEIFITSKLWVTEYGEEKSFEAIDKMLKRLDLDYVDLVLLHLPFKDYIGAYKGLEKALNMGKIKSIGLSNFEHEQFDKLMKEIKIKPVVNQVEVHPYCQQKELIKKMDSFNIKIEALCPLCHGLNDIFVDENLKKIGDKYKKTVAQVILRWQIQLGIITLPKSAKPERIKENISVFDFTLSDDDIKIISGLDGTKPRLQPSDEEFEKEIEKYPAPPDF